MRVKYPPPLPPPPTEDPVAISKPCCPDSITKFLLDLFSEKSTAGMFYTTDMRVLIDIVVRQLTDLCPGMAVRAWLVQWVAA